LEVILRDPDPGWESLPRFGSLILGDGLSKMPSTWAISSWSPRRAAASGSPPCQHRRG